MTETELRRLVRNYNRQQILVGCCAAVGAVALWLIAFWVWRFFAGLWLGILGFDHVKSWSFEIAIVLTALLAIEGVRYHKRLFNLVEYHESAYYQGGLLETDTGHALNAYYGNPAGAAYLISQGLFSAPRSTVFAIQFFRSIIRASDDTIAAATEVYNALKLQRGWVSVGVFPSHGRALALLDKLKLIWTEVRADGCHVRIPPLTSRN